MTNNLLGEVAQVLEKKGYGSLPDKVSYTKPPFGSFLSHSIQVDLFSVDEGLEVRVHGEIEPLRTVINSDRTYRSIKEQKKLRELLGFELLDYATN